MKMSVFSMRVSVVSYSNVSVIVWEHNIFPSTVTQGKCFINYDEQHCPGCCHSVVVLRI